jgi:hypothetical protein
MMYKVTVRKAAAILSFAVLALTGCDTTDKRLVEDEQSCHAMGHSLGTPDFKQCLQDLNDRRCAMVRKKNETMHVVTTDCSRL